MSMLAERKIKQKWSLNPRGNVWADDQNKFGQKMLEKMGWSKGKGLGANMQGNPEHIKIKYKHDSKGVGHKDRDDQWTEHEDQFSNLLKALSSERDDTIIVNDKESSSSLVDKSKNSKARIHYKKFTRGKDLSQYSEKDLANVFGRKQLKKEKKVEEEVKEEEVKDDKTDDNRFLKGGCMADYFKKKMGNGQLGVKNGTSVGENEVSKKDSDIEDERPSFGFGFKNTEETNNVNQQDDSNNDGINKDTRNERSGFGLISFTKSKSANQKHKSKNSTEETNESLESENVTPETCGSLKNDEWSNNKKKKNSNVHVDLNGETSFTEKEDEKSNNSHVDLNGETSMQNGESPKRKKKKNKNLNNSVSNQEAEKIQKNEAVNGSVKINKNQNENNSDVINGEYSLEENNSRVDLSGQTSGQNAESSKKKKKRKNKDLDNSILKNEENNNSELLKSVNNDESSNASIKNNADSINPCESINGSDSINLELSESKKKKKKSKEQTSAPTEETLTESSKKNKKKNKDESKNIDCDNKNQDIDTTKKKSKKKTNEETPTFVSYLSEDLENENPKKRKLEESEDRTPKKKKKKSQEVGLSNPGFDPVFHTPPMERHNLNTINEAEEDNVEAVENVSIDVNSSEKKKKKKDKDNDDQVNEIVAEDEKDKKKKSKKRKLEESEAGVENACFNGLDESQVEEVVENPYEVKPKKKKKSKNKDKGESLDQIETPKKPLGIDNPALNLSPPIDEDIQCDLILNTTTAPASKPPQRRKSVTFSEVNKEHVIPNREQLARQSELFEINNQILEESAKKKKSKVPEGIDNEAFYALPERQREKLRYEERFRYAVDTYELQVENALNERKSLMVGDIDSQLEKGELHEEGVKLPFKKATFMGVNYGYFSSDIDSAKAGYKHFIRGDIVVKFKNSNLHEIKGYGIEVMKVQS